MMTNQTILNTLLSLLVSLAALEQLNCCLLTLFQTQNIKSNKGKEFVLKETCYITKRAKMTT